MSSKKIIHFSDICIVVMVLMVYGCASSNKETAVDWSGMNYSKIACNGLNEAECKKNTQNVAVIDSSGKR